MGEANGGEIIVRRNWFPRWKATLNGEEVAITQTADGYMSIAGPASGDVSLVIEYRVDWLDWLARACTALGIAALALMCLRFDGRLRVGRAAQRRVPRAIPTVRSARQ
jgi:hypothetical protein